MQAREKGGGHTPHAWRHRPYEILTFFDKNETFSGLALSDPVGAKGRGAQIKRPARRLSCGPFVFFGEGTAPCPFSVMPLPSETAGAAATVMLSVPEAWPRAA